MMAAGTGCQPGVADPQQAAPRLAPTDPCAERLHELCGDLLMYNLQYGGMPASLDDLQTRVGPLPVPLVCPQSGKPYVYYPHGLKVAGQPGLLVLSDAAPAHAGQRLGIVLIAGDEGRPPVPGVVLVQEPPFQQALKQANAK